MRGTKVEKCYSVKELNDRAKTAPVESTPIRFYIRSAEHLFKQAKIYQQEGDLQTSYILYMRFCNLVINELHKHVEYGQTGYKAAITSLNKSAMTAMEEIGKLKPVLEKKCQEYQQYITQREEMQLAQAQAQAQVINAHHQQYEAHRRHESDRAAQERQDVEWAGRQPVQGWSLAKALEGVPGLNTTTMQAGQQHLGHQRDYSSPDGVSEIQYPEYHRHHHHHHPRLPPKILIEEDVHEFSQGLRTLIVPVRLLDRFLNIVRPNTNRKLETCGILAGVLSRNKLTVTTLIIPKQTATSDTCSTTNEDELFEYQSERDLMTLGWIHTHPTQTCFMSSVDLHTHCSYQLMLPEAIAIVCAPSHEKDYGVFRLTDPPGLQVITNCRQKPLFHQHPGEDDIYTDACDQGHVELVDLDLDIVDLRGK
ncbi:hypothetical protein BGX33_009813 [Mortierella sp. NVP41]|nr:hypothetical protein BGX33_009813 [Mortierella sp. NVP41]